MKRIWITLAIIFTAEVSVTLWLLARYRETPPKNEVGNTAPPRTR